MNETIYEISLVGRIRIDAHSLNNEGTVGNVTEPRTIILANGEKTDGISGEMLKHIHAEALWQIAKENKVSLCPACQILSPMKADGNEAVTKIKEAKPALNEALKCAICDLHGFLVQKPTLSRKSTVEFGWAIALPTQFYRDIHVHTRVAAGEKEREEGTEAGVSEQMIYNRPTRSGIYAFVSVFQPWRIGLNEIDYTYSIDDNARKNRYELVLEAYKAMIARLEGAMTTTRLPHFGEFQGAIAIKKNAAPVPVISPLADGYIQQMKTIIGQQNVQEFSSLASFMQEIDNLKSALPYKLGAP
ncbi:MAG: DevR family CRISPR-associated autoregulator [Candidatus Bathyarchaeia archaeon]